MGSIDRIYGSIFCPKGPSNDPKRIAELAAANLWALEMLPLHDTEYPPLARTMFALNPIASQGSWKQMVIHFGLQLKDVAEDWDEWLEKFESFLERLRWQQARVHLELEYVPESAGGGRSQEHVQPAGPRVFAYRWERRGSEASSDRRAWGFEGGPREFGAKVTRFREAEIRLTNEVQTTPPTAEKLQLLIQCLGRLRRFEEACQYFQQLDSLDPEAAKQTPIECLESWADRHLMPGI